MTATLRAGLEASLEDIRNFAVAIRDEVGTAHQRGAVKDIEDLAELIIEEVDACCEEEETE